MSSFFCRCFDAATLQITTIMRVQLRILIVGHNGRQSQCCGYWHKYGHVTKDAAKDVLLLVVLALLVLITLTGHIAKRTPTHCAASVRPCLESVMSTFMPDTAAWPCHSCSCCCCCCCGCCSCYCDCRCCCWCCWVVPQLSFVCVSACIPRQLGGARTRHIHLTVVRVV